MFGDNPVYSTPIIHRNEFISRNYPDKYKRILLKGQKKVLFSIYYIAIVVLQVIMLPNSHKVCPVIINNDPNQWTLYPVIQISTNPSTVYSQFKCRSKTVSFTENLLGYSF